MAPEIATRIDNRYDVLGELGRGGMGVVYKANDLKMDRLVAIKVMTAHAPGRDEYQERFLREAKSIAKLQHPNIVVVYDYGYHAGSPYMAMEYVEGVPLDKVIASRISLTLLAKVDYVVQVCQALHYAHQQSIVHRDVKPGNIMVLDGGRRVKLLDFGIARAGGASNLSKSGLAMGTTCYMSPEQTKGQKDLDGRADIFSAGVVLYELLTGKPPWTGDSDYDIMTKIIHEPHPPLSGLGNYPLALDRVLEGALAKEAGARYATAEKMAQDLSELETPLKEQALEEALVQLEHGDLLRANDLVSQILRIDTRHREAVELRARLQQMAQLQQRGEQVRQLRRAAEEAVGQKRYTEALAAVEQAITIDTANTELFHYRELIRHEVKRREDIRKKLELAKRAQEINDLSTAQELVDKALEADPTDTQARMMKSSLEQERKRQQQQEIAEEAARALAVRAFPRAKEFIQQLEAIDPAFTSLGSLKKALLEGEAEEKRRIEIENLIREIRRVLESGDVAQCLSATEDALAKFPAEPRLVRLRTQAEALRDAAERERAIQEKMVLAKKLSDQGQNAEALAIVENALIRLGADHRLQALLPQLRQAVEHERRLQAEQAVLSQARNAMQAEDFEFALKVLAAAQADFPESTLIADALQAAQAAMARKGEAVERERQLRTQQVVLAQAQKAMQAADFDSAVTILTTACFNFPNSKEIADALQAAQAAKSRKADAVERDRKLQAERTAITQAREAMQASDFESALKILTVARIDFPNSKEIAAALQTAQAANARKTEESGAILRKREITEALERALANESDPELQVRLAEEAARRIPGNDAADRMLARVRDRHRQIASVITRANQFEQAQRHGDAIQECERIRQLWPQCPNLDAQIARLKAAQTASVVAPEPPSAALHFSATKIMGAAPATAPSPAPQAAPPPAKKPSPTPVPVATAPSTATIAHSELGPKTETEVDRNQGPRDVPVLHEAGLRRPSLPIPDPVQPVLRSKRLLFAIAGAAAIVVLIPVLYFSLRTTRKSEPKPPVAQPHVPIPTPRPVAPDAPPLAMGQLTVRMNVEDADILVDGVFKAGTGGRVQTIPVVAGSHKITVKAQGYDTPTEQKVEIAKDRISTLKFALTKATGNTSEPEPDTYLILKSTAGAKVRIDGNAAEDVQPDGNFSLKTNPGPHQVELSLAGYQPLTKTVTVKAGNRRPIEMALSPKPAPAIVLFEPSPSSIQEGESVELRWVTKNATGVTIDGLGDFPATSSTRVTPKATGTVPYTLHAGGDGTPAQKTVTVNIGALPKPAVTLFTAGPEAIQAGKSSKLVWATQNAEGVEISSDAGPVGSFGANGEHSVTPAKTTRYTLTANGHGKTSAPQFATVTIESTPVPPASTPAATEMAPVPKAAGSAEDPEIAALKNTIQRLIEAYETEDTEEIKKVWSLPKNIEKALKENTFSKFRGLKEHLQCDGFKLASESSATCTCTEKQDYTTQDNQRLHTPSVRVTLQFGKENGTWRVLSKH